MEKTWLSELPEKEGYYLWKNSLGIYLLHVIFVPPYNSFGVDCGNGFYANQRHVSRFSGEFLDITDLTI
jgi:hypothetical protein